jgi:hypothetical protein
LDDLPQGELSKGWIQVQKISNPCNILLFTNTFKNIGKTCLLLDVTLTFLFPAVIKKIKIIGQYIFFYFPCGRKSPF